jgi:hypothetical protein
MEQVGKHVKTQFQIKFENTSWNANWNAVKLGYNELGYNKQIFKPNWSH